MCGRIERFENDAPRHFMRYGLLAAVGDEVAADLAARPFDARVGLPLRHLTCASDFTPGRDEIGPSGNLSSTCRMILIDSRNSTIRTL